MIRRSLLVCGLIVYGVLALGAKCVVYTWSSPDDQALYASAHWNDYPLTQDAYAFTPDYPVHERAVGPCYQDNPEKPLVVRGALACMGYVLDVDLPTGSVTVHNVEELFDLFGPIDSEADAASFAKATIGGFARYDGATATADGRFLVRMTDLRDNCTETTGTYAIVYEFQANGVGRIVAEEVRHTTVGGGRLCVD